MLDILILAAGKGTRMKSDLPKVLQPIAGKPMLRHVLDTALELKPTNIGLIVGHGAEQVGQKVADVKLTLVQQADQLGTGHAVLQALPVLTKDTVVLILYGDVPLIKPETLKTLIASTSQHSLGLLTVNLQDPRGYGRIVRDSHGDVLNITEQKDATAEQLKITEVNTGIMAVTSTLLSRWLPKLTNNNAQKEYYLTDIIAMAKADQVKVTATQPASEYEVMGINDRLQQSQLERIYQAAIAAKLMSEGLSLIDPNRFDCRGTLRAGRDCIVDINCIFEGEVTLGKGVCIGANCIIKNSEISDNTVIAANSILEGAKIAENCVVGPFARIRPGTHLMRQAKIGNFVETKQATVGIGSKINHLSYVGDAVLGSHVNVGAGTITCNYDGANKSQTTVADNVFVGSNCALVAPVSIESDATIGAGSVITRSVKAGQLSVSRGRQTNIDGWTRPTKNP